MYGLKEWAMEVDYNASKKTRIQQENDDVRDETIDCHALTITKILKRLNDLESIVQTQDNLQEEQTLIIKNNNEKICLLESTVDEQIIVIKNNSEKICMLERIVEQHKDSMVENIVSVKEQRELLDETIVAIETEHEKVKTLCEIVKCEHESTHELIVCDKKRFIDDVIVLQGQIDNIQYSSSALYVNLAVFKIISNLANISCVSCLMTQDSFIRASESFSKSTLHQVVSTIDSEWSIDDFNDLVNSTITTFHGKTRFVLSDAIAWHHVDVVVQEALMSIEGCTEYTRKMFSREEKILRSHENLKPLYEHLLKWDYTHNKFDTR